jgi:hypothetical protein
MFALCSYGDREDIGEVLASRHQGRRRKEKIVSNQPDKVENAGLFSIFPTR